MSAALAAPDLARMEALAAMMAEQMVSRRVDAFRRHQAQLDAIETGLSALSPADLSARLDVIFNRELTTHHRYFGHGGEIVMINLQAARRYAVELLEGAA
jgi:hypothetical protein